MLPVIKQLVSPLPWLAVLQQILHIVRRTHGEGRPNGAGRMAAPPSKEGALLGFAGERSRQWRSLCKREQGLETARWQH